MAGNPVTARNNVHTPAFNKFYQQNKDMQLWQGYCRTYVREVQAQFMKSLTKSPKLYFPENIQ